MSRASCSACIFLALLVVGGGILGLAGSAVSSPPPSSPDQQEARAILLEIDDLWRATSSQGTVRMEVKTANYTRTMRMEIWSKGKDKSLVRIVSPLKEKDTASLKTGNTMYTYLPKTDRTIRLTSSMMMSSWMGSHFTNDDLVKESRLSEDYDPRISFRGKKDGREIIEFTLQPRQDAAVVWGKIVMTVTAQGHLPLLATYYDEDNALARTIYFSEVKNMGGRLLPALLKVVPTDKPGEHTELIYESMRFDLDLPESLFSLLELRRR
ncbi:MAG: outer membrane lipoprotein-sorting protein [Deltaproteobacteria bacterium]|nr:outer membrane lipoprotein-sorting protein [Deltaproteobacteria bacterium]